MSEEQATLRRVQDGLYHLQRGLTPFVQQRMKTHFGTNWMQYAARASGSKASDALDTYALLKTMIENWGDAFREGLPKSARTHVSTAFDARNATAHLTLPLSDAEALRYLDAIVELLRIVKAPAAEITAVKTLYDEQRASGVAAPPPSPTQADMLAESSARPPMKPWVEVVLPHPDVLENRFKQAEFAADLFAVDAGLASEDYADARSFFQKTFLTVGITRVLKSAIERLTGDAGEPVVGLQTSFGGGKTHTMLALYHLAKAANPVDLPGVKEVAAAAASAWKPATVAVFVGTAKGPDTSLTLDDGPKVYTVWGYLAYRLLGEEGLAIVADAERARTNPGSEQLVQLLSRAAPCLILLDELVAFARQLDDDRFEAFLSFIQSLTEAVKLVPGAMVVGSLPESNAEAGGDKGVAALVRLQAVFGRTQSAWLPATGNETYEIIRRRLFQELDSDGEIARDATLKAFTGLYRSNAAEFPMEVREGKYADLMKVSYPIHPQLFDVLSQEWSGLERFQKTRGVLKLMANVVGVLWSERNPDPLILPSRVPVFHERIRANLLFPLDPAFAAVVDREVDGPSALPSRMEANPQRRITQYRAATRAARSVFLCSAPMAGAPNAGINGQSLRLACVEPGDQIAVFGDALRELMEKTSYLYEEGGRYWFSTQPTLGRLADDRGRAFPDHIVADAITAELRKESGHRGGFARVYAAQDDPVEALDQADLGLVILGPASAHSGRGVSDTEAVRAATDVMARCRSAQRLYRNSIIFCAADSAQLAQLDEVVRRWLAWTSIVDDVALADAMTTNQRRDAQEKASQHREGAGRAIRSAWSHLLVPTKGVSATDGVAYEFEHFTLTGRDRPSIAAAAYEKCKADGVIKERLAGEVFVRFLDPVWPVDRPHVPVREIREWCARYVYMPKFRDGVAFAETIRDLVGRLNSPYGLADGYDEVSGRYVGLKLDEAAVVDLGADPVLVTRTAALSQRPERDRAPVQVGGDGGGGSEDHATPAAGGPTQPRRFFGAVDLNPDRPIPDLQRIVEGVISELRRAQGVRVRLSLEIEIETPKGFRAEDVSVVKDNAASLKFKRDSTGFSDE